MNIRNQIIIDALANDKVLVYTCPIYDENGNYKRTGISIKVIDNPSQEFIFELTDLFDIVHFSPRHLNLEDKPISLKIKIKGNPDTFIKRIINNEEDIIDVYSEYSLISNISTNVVKNVIDCLYDVDYEVNKIVQKTREKYNNLRLIQTPRKGIDVDKTTAE